MSGTVVALFFFAIIAIACCASSGDSSSSNTTQRRSAPVRRNVSYDYDDDGYCECPSCGSPYYDGYCEECGYPDVNQGWLGEEYG